MPSLLDLMYVRMLTQNVQREEEGVDIRLHRIIYKVIEEIEQAMKGMLDPEFEEKLLVKQKFVKQLKYQKLVQLLVHM